MANCKKYQWSHKIISSLTDKQTNAYWVPCAEKRLRLEPSPSQRVKPCSFLLITSAQSKSQEILFLTVFSVLMSFHLSVSVLIGAFFVTVLVATLYEGLKIFRQWLVCRPLRLLFKDICHSTSTSLDVTDPEDTCSNKETLQQLFVRFPNRRWAWLSFLITCHRKFYLSFIENKYIHIKQEQTTWLANLADWENKNQKQNECAVVNASSCLNIVTETCPWQRLLTPPPSSWENIIES